MVGFRLQAGHGQGFSFLPMPLDSVNAFRKCPLGNRKKQWRSER